jgi:hypothetical protein
MGHVNIIHLNIVVIVVELQFLVLAIIDTATKSAGIDAFFLGKVGGLLNVIVGGTVEFFLEDNIGVMGFELSLEVT